MHCFALNAESLIDKAVDLIAVGGTFGGNRKPTKFLCLTLKLLQLQPEKEIIVEYITNEQYKYLRVLGVFYMRLTGKAVDVYQYLEPLLQDYRKIRIRDAMGKYSITHIDEIVHGLLTESHYFNISLPSLPSRWSLEKAGVLKPRESLLADLDDLDKEEQISPSPERADSSKHKKTSKSKTEEISNSKEMEKGQEKEKSRRYKSIFTKNPMAANEDGGRQEVLSIDETNKLREKLGLKKLV
ncbi:hypothetical protein MHBO_000798 [Bonamia ostreae]|uniref:Pre-mRNA-splicing factor 38 n=1 Tax=Bonamia ostreae TaxID=126728 RepID=A0ABV2AGV2_9EUKA